MLHAMPTLNCALRLTQGRGRGPMAVGSLSDGLTYPVWIRLVVEQWMWKITIKSPFSNRSSIQNIYFPQLCYHDRREWSMHNNISRVEALPM